MNWMLMLEGFVKLAPAVAGGIVTVLHLTGADKHKTVAGQIADGLVKTGQAAAGMQQLLNGVQQQKTPQTVATSAGSSV